MTHRFFPQVKDKIPFEGKDSKNPLAFKYHDKGRRVGSKTMGTTWASL